MADPPLPPFAHIPGQNARHPEGWFDGLKIDPDMALRSGIFYFEQGYFWECHEVLEAVWLAQSNPSAERDMAQAMIQLANARLKLRMGRPKAARRLCAMVMALLDELPEEMLGQNVPLWRARCEDTSRTCSCS